MPTARGRVYELKSLTAYSEVDEVLENSYLEPTQLLRPRILIVGETLRRMSSTHYAYNCWVPP